jgi:hypothetical protein
MFKELFIETDAEDLSAEEDRRRRVRRSRRARPAMAIRPAARGHRSKAASTAALPAKAWPSG